MAKRATIALALVGVLAAASIPLAAVARAQVVPITATLDRDTVDVSDTFTLTVTVVGETSVPLPTLPPIDGAQLVGRTTKSSIVFRDGAASATFNFAYNFQPLKSGVVVIDPIKVSMQGTTYETERLSVTVLGSGVAPFPSQQPQTLTSDKLSGQNYYIEAEVDNDRPYLGQQITYRVRFYAADSQRGGDRYRPPAYRGFWNGQDTMKRVLSAQAGGREYRVSEFRTFLLPTLIGESVIEPASMLARSLMGIISLQEIRYATAPVTVNVRPLPAGAPTSFAGAVGRFAIQASVDVDQVAAGDPITMTVTISGEGNLPTQADPPFPDMPGWRVFESKTDTNVSVVNDSIRGTRTYERTLVPNSEGSFIIPAIEFSYFEPEGEQYHLLTTKAVPVQVSRGTAPSPPDVALPSTRSEVVQTASDIRHIRPVPDSLRARSDGVTSSQLYWIAWLLPVVAMAAAGAWKYRERLAPAIRGAATSTTPVEAALAATQTARDSGIDPFPAAGRALTDYLQARLGRPGSGLSRTAIVDTLNGRGVESELAARVDAMLTLIEGGRYGPGAATDAAADLLDDTERLIEALEREFGQ